MLKEEVYTLLLNYEQTLDDNEVQLALVVVSRVDPFVGSMVAIADRSKCNQRTYLYYGRDKKEATTLESLYKKLGVNVTFMVTELEVASEGP